MIRQSIHLVASLDVEEEGLFRNGYSLAVHQPVSNVKSLIRLAPLLRLGLRPTLFCDNAVFENDPAWASVEDMAARYPLEIGAHMHHWNTPPIVLEGTETHSVPSSSLTAAQFSAKLDHLLEAGRKRIGRRPSSFRMGYPAGTLAPSGGSRHTARRLSAPPSRPRCRTHPPGSLLGPL